MDKKHQCPFPGRFGECTIDGTIVDNVVEPEKLMNEAIGLALALGGDRLTAYAFSKAALQAPILRTIADDTARLDEGMGAAWCSDDARQATARTYAKLKSRKKD